MQIFVNQTLESLYDGELELQGCKIDSISGVAKVNLVDCEVGSISGYATVTLSKCQVNTIDENVVVEKAVDCRIKTIKGNTSVRTINSSTVYVITDKAIVREMGAKCIVKLCEGSSCIQKISHSEVKRIGQTAIVDKASDCDIEVVTGNSSVNKAAPNVTIDVVNDHANLGLVQNSHINELSGNAESFCIENSTIDYILGNVIINNMNGCTSLRVDESVTIRSMEDCVLQSPADAVTTAKSKNSSKLFQTLLDNEDFNAQFKPFYEGEIELCDNVVDSLYGNIKATLTECTVNDIGSYAIATLYKCNVQHISGNAVITKAVDCNIGTVEDFATIKEMHNTHIGLVDKHAKVSAMDDKSIIDCVKDTSTRTSTQDTTPTLWKNAGM